MPTSLQLSTSQRSQLAALRDQAIALGTETVGAWVPFYDFLAKAIRSAALPLASGQVSSVDVANIRLGNLLPDDQLQTMVWLMGGMQVNAANGWYSTVIREYNVRQGQLRGYTFTPAMLQSASNLVAERMAAQILLSQSAPGFLPKVTEIGVADLSAVRDVLYPGNTEPGSGMYLNQAWPGIIMLGKQGEDFLPRLVATGAAEAADTLRDMQEMLLEVAPLL